MSDELKPKARRGFACISPELRREISSKGGKAAHAAGTAHEFTSEEAREAGRRGGVASHAAKKRREADKPIPYVPTDMVNGKVPPTLA